MNHPTGVDGTSSQEGRLFVGTSGFAYKEWKPEFYPADLKNADMLSYYAQRFPSVEINNTFYRAPTEKVLTQWLAQTPETFRFTLKAPQRITHFSRLRDVEEHVSFFLNTARALGDRLGCILFQLPPSLKHDQDLLDTFLGLLPGEPFRFAVEFRHDSWRIDAVEDSLRANGVAWCVAEDETDVELVRTAKDFVYLRLRRLDYTPERISSWAEQIRDLLAEGTDAYVYFKHDDDPSGVRFGSQLRELVEQTSRRSG